MEGFRGSVHEQNRFLVEMCSRDITRDYQEGHYQTNSAEPPTDFYANRQSGSTTEIAWGRLWLTEGQTKNAKISRYSSLNDVCSG